MSRRVLIFLLGLLCSPVMMWAQFNLSENDPGHIRWQQRQTVNFRVIYPRGYDSIAVEYLQQLEHFRPRVATSIGMVSGQFQRRPLDVFLHTSNAASNGMVSLTPLRMEMYTVSKWTEGSSLPWITDLAVHEGRHAAQMQMGFRRIFRPFRFITGQLIAGGVCAYPGSLLMEGDAVVAETALTKGGRGRDAGFLARYMYAFDHGDVRNYPKWRFGSYYRPTPDNYALGYAMISGARIAFDKPYFMADYFDYVGRRPYDPWPLRHALRRASGHKFQQNFHDVMAVHYDTWASDTLSRGPFMPAEQVSKPSRVMMEFSNVNELDDGEILYVIQDIYHNPSIWRMDADRKAERKVVSLPHYVGAIEVMDSTNTILWNEVHRNPRWGQVQTSVVRAYNKEKHINRAYRGEGNLVNPVGIDGHTFAAIDIEGDGTQKLCLIDMLHNIRIEDVVVPRELQACFVAYDEGDYYIASTTSDGVGVWSYVDGQWNMVLPPVPVNFRTFEFSGGVISFTCDHNGSDEFYSYDIGKKELLQLSNTKYGGSDFYLRGNGDVVFVQMNDKGSAVYRTKAADLCRQPVVWGDIYHNPVAEKLSAQEDTLVFDQRLRHPRRLDMDSDLNISEAKPYRKFVNGFHIHSWAPLYVDMDVIDDISYANVVNVASLGATAWLQNNSSTFYGQIGYKAAPDQNGRWFHSGHLNLTYRGLYPVFELQLHVNESKAADYSRVYFRQGSSTPVESGRYMKAEASRPYVFASLRSYVPLQWNSGIWYFGAIPQASIKYTNNTLDVRHTFLYDAGARFYAVQSTPSAAVYPRWGVGTELRWLDPYAYWNTYAYVPGVCHGQGLRLSAIWQRKTALSTSDIYLGGVVSLLPRGYQSDAVSSFGEGWKLSADYAIPFYMGDWNIGSAFLCTRGIVTPHFDYTSIRAQVPVHCFAPGREAGWLYSAGASFEMEFASFFWIKTPVRLGVTYSYNGGSLAPYFKMDTPLGRHYIGAIFNIDIPN